MSEESLALGIAVVIKDPPAGIDENVVSGEALIGFQPHRPI
jgi:hypothetical protein